MADVDRLLLTHFDIDQVGALHSLTVDAPLYAMEPDASMVTGEQRPPMTNHKGLIQRVADLFVSHPPGPVTIVADEETVGEFIAYHTPGHTPGHVVYHHPGLEVALLGDLVRGTDGSLGTLQWMMAYDQGGVRKSIRQLTDRADFECACPGHGDPVRCGGAEALLAVATR